MRRNQRTKRGQPRRRRNRNGGPTRCCSAPACRCCAASAAAGLCRWRSPPSWRGSCSATRSCKGRRGRRPPAPSPTGEEPSQTRGIEDGENGERKRSFRMLSTILIVVLILLLIGALPTWPYSAGWGYAPGGLLGTVLVIIVILALLGRI